MKLTPRQKQALSWYFDTDAHAPESPVGADVTVSLNLEKKGLLKSVQTYPEGHPWRTGEAFGYEVRHYYLTDAGKKMLDKWGSNL